MKMSDLIESKKNIFLLLSVILLSINLVAIAEETEEKPLLLVSSSNTQKNQTANSQKKKNVIVLPLPPQTGTPDDKFSPGGTRQESTFVNSCLESSSSLRYILRENIRDNTISAYPIFWFCLPNTQNNYLELEFTLTETESGQLIYKKNFIVKQGATILGISLPQLNQYALKPNLNYTWQLNSQNINQDQTNNYNVILNGWINRLTLDTNLQKKLQNNSIPKYEVYLQENILYDALSDIIKNYQAEPNNPKILQAWQKFLDL